MIKSLFAALALSATPLLAFAAPLGMADATDLLADNRAAVPADVMTTAPADAMDDADADEAAPDPATTPDVRKRASVARPDAARASVAKPAANARKGADAHKDHPKGTRWQSLLPGVMK